MHKQKPIVEENYDLSEAGYIDIPDDEKDEELCEWGRVAAVLYDIGEYDKALRYLNWLLKKRPSLKPYVFYYIRVCKRVLSVPLTTTEVEYEVRLERKRALPRWLKWTVFLGKFLVRCKWCGRYTTYVDPNKPTFGFGIYSNCCNFCERMYPMPSWFWDSPTGRTYSYFRGSFGGEEKFYKEFERDYNPSPLREI